MTRRRWIADEVSGERAALTGEHADHLTNVLRARVGQEFDIATGAGVRRGTIAAIERGRVEFTLGEAVAGPRPAEVTLLIAIFKFDRMEWAIEKCTELGVARIIPFVAHRTDRHLATSAVKRVERWRRIARQAAEQSRRETAPEVADVIEFAAALKNEDRVRIVLAESGERVALGEAIRNVASESGVTLAVGPEGGWTESELRSFAQAGWMAASLGNTILRAETAAMAAMAVMMAERQGL